MRLIKSTDLKEGMMLGKDIILENGTLLIACNVMLTRNQIESIIKLDILHVYVLDEDRASEIVIKNSQWEKEYRKAFLVIQSVFHNARIGNKLEIVKVQQAMEPIITELIKDSNILCKIKKINDLDQYTFGHSINVALLATITGKWLGFSVEELKELAIAGFLHDIGKTIIPIEILNKPGALTNEEFQIIKKHSIYGYNYLKNTPNISMNILDGILQHHERMDGSGYPFKLKSHEIHTYAKIIAIVDTFDAIISKRPYKPRLSPFKAIDILYGSLFHTLDPHIGSIFLENISLLYTGTTVKLNSNEVGKIITINKHFPSRPLIKVDDKFVDLSKNMNYEILDLFI